jgi:hypothetical protein
MTRARWKDSRVSIEFLVLNKNSLCGGNVSRLLILIIIINVNITRLWTSGRIEELRWQCKEIHNNENM